MEDLTRDEKLAALWLITNPSRDLCGFTSVSNKRFEFETGLTVENLEGASKGLPTSIQQLPGGVWFSVNFLRHQFGKGGRLKLGNKVVIAAARHAAQLPDPLANAFFKAYPELRELDPSHSSEISKNNPPPIPHTVKPDGVREREREGAGEGAKASLPGGIDPVTIVSAYPRNENKESALKLVAQQLAGGEDAEAMLAGTRAIAAIIPRLPSGHLNARLVSSLTFFRDKRWKDDPATWLRNGGKSGQVPGTLQLNGRREVPIG